MDYPEYRFFILLNYMSNFLYQIYWRLYKLKWNTLILPLLIIFSTSHIWTFYYELLYNHWNHQSSPILRVPVFYIGSPNEPSEIRCSLKLICFRCSPFYMSPCTCKQSRTAPGVFWFLFQTCPWRRFQKRCLWTAPSADFLREGAAGGPCRPAPVLMLILNTVPCASHLFSH